jgi:hypothetical protein
MEHSLISYRENDLIHLNLLQMFIMIFWLVLRMGLRTVNIESHSTSGPCVLFAISFIKSLLSYMFFLFVEN